MDRNSLMFQPSEASMQVVEDTALLMDKTWESVQCKTFAKWLNNKLSVRELPTIQSLFQDIADGVLLINLLEIIGDTTLGRYNRNPKLRIQKVENVNKALEFIKFRGVNLTNIGAEDIVDQNSKLILGMIWTIILRFTIAEISEEGLTAKEGLLLWCQRKTEPYDDVNVRDFTYSWQDGLAFCALIHRHRPDLLDYHSLDKADRHGNTALAFEVAERELGIAKLLDVEDVCDMAKPDERSIMTYVAQYFHAFSSLDKIETAGRRVAKFAEVVQSVWEMANDYERRASQLMNDLGDIQSVWQNSSFEGTYADAKQQSAEFNYYKNTQKRTWVAEKHEIDTLLGNIQTKLNTYNLNPYNPPSGLTPQDLDDAWNTLLSSEGERRRTINEQIRLIKENLTMTFANQANEFQNELDAISTALTNLSGDLESQLETVQQLSARVSPLSSSLEDIKDIDEQCREAGIEENDYTVYSADDLIFDLDLIQKAIAKKRSFIENQVVSRNMTNLTPAQLEEFESTFRYFDKDNSNTLSALEFRMGLESLGIVYQDEDFEAVFEYVAQGGETVTFEQFIGFMVSITEDQTTPEQLREAFRAVAGEKDYVTEVDLKMTHVPGPVIEYLTQSMPVKHDGYDYSQYLDSVFTN